MNATEKVAALVAENERLQNELDALQVRYNNLWVGMDSAQVEHDALAAQVATLRAALMAFVQVDDTDKNGRALVHAQGQGMDGYTKLANYEACISKARTALAETVPKGET